MKKIIIVVMCLCLCLSCLGACGSEEDLQWYIFTDIEECSNIELYKHADATIEYYSTPEKDRKLKDLPYHSFFGVNYKSDELSFELFAYEFQNEAATRKYFKNHTGKDTDYNSNFCSSWGSTSFEIVIYHGTCAYVAYTKPKQRHELREFFEKVFSVNIMEIDHNVEFTDKQT